MRLVYEIAANADQLKRVMRSVEGEARANNRRMGRDAAAAVYGPGRKEAAAARRYEESLAKEVARAQVALDKQRSRALMSSVKTEERERLRADRNVARAAESLDRQRARGLAAQHRTNEQAAIRAARIQAQTAARIGGGAARTLGGGVAAGLGTVTRYGGAALGIAGGFAAAGAIQEQAQVARMAALLANQANDPSMKADLVKNAGNVTGFKGSEKLGAMSAFVGKTGDVDMATRLIGDLGKLSLVTGSNYEEVGAAAGLAYKVLSDTIKDPKELQAAILDVAQAWAQQGNEGTIELKDMAKVAGRMGAATRKFAGGPVGLLRSIGALGQLAAGRGGAASAEEAATALTRVPSDIVKNQAKFKKEGIDIFEPGTNSTKLADPVEIFVRTLTKTKGNLTKLTPLFNEESRKVFEGLAPVFLDAEEKNTALPKAQQRKYGEAGGEALRREHGALAGTSYKPEDFERQFQSMAEESSTKFTEASKAFNAAVGDQLLPVVTKSIGKFAEQIPTIVRLTSALAKFADYVLDNPLKGAGIIVGAAIAKDVSANLVNSGLNAAIETAFKGGLASGLKSLGTISLVAGSVMLVADAWSELTAQTGGAEGVQAGLAGVLDGRGFAKGVDDYLNERAKRNFASQPPATLPAPGMATAPPGGDILGKQKDGQVVTKAQFDSASPENQKAFLQTAAELTAAGKALSEAAASIKKSGGPEASRTAPIISPSRG
jgi:hypothetical protein